MKFLALFLLIPLTACTTFQQLSGERSIPPRILYMGAGQTVETDDLVVHLGVSLGAPERKFDENEEDHNWRGDLFLDRISFENSAGDNDTGYVFGTGIRYCFSNSSMVQPYVGVGGILVFIEGIDASEIGFYGRAGVDVLFDGFRIMLDWRTLEIDSEGDRLLTIGMGVSF